MIVTGWLADHYRARALTASISALLGMIGFVLFFTSTEKSIRYGSLFLSVTGIYATPPPLSVIMAVGSVRELLSDLPGTPVDVPMQEPHYRRAVSIAAGFVATNAGGILSTWVSPETSEKRSGLTENDFLDVPFETIAQISNRHHRLPLLLHRHLRLLDPDHALPASCKSEEGGTEGGAVGAVPGNGKRRARGLATTR